MTLEEFKFNVDRHGWIKSNISGSRIVIGGEGKFHLNEVQPKYRMDNIDVDGEIEFKNVYSNNMGEKGDVKIEINKPINTNIIFNNEGNVTIVAPSVNSRLEFNNKGNVYLDYAGGVIKIIPSNLKFNNSGNVSLLTDNLPSGFEFNNGKDVAIPYIEDTNLIKTIKTNGTPLFALNMAFFRAKIQGIERNRLVSLLNKRLLGIGEPHGRD